MDSEYTRNIQMGKTIHLSWVPSHAGVCFNEEVAKQAATIGKVLELQIPHTEYFCDVKKYRNKGNLQESFPSK